MAALHYAEDFIGLMTITGWWLPVSVGALSALMLLASWRYGARSALVICNARPKRRA